MNKVFKIALGSLVATGVATAAAQAEVLKLKATLNGAAEVPAVTGTGKGMAELTLDTATKELTWKITYEGLTGDALAAHLHGPADATANAGVLVNVGAGGMKTPLEGKATLTDEQVAAVTGGKSYINVHTMANKAGEIRGQVGK